MVRGEELHAACDLDRLRETPHGNPGRQLARVLRGVAAPQCEDLIDHARVNLARADRIDPDVVGRVIECHAAGDLQHRAFARTVRDMPRLK